MLAKYCGKLLSFIVCMLALGMAFETPSSAYAATTIIVDDNGFECPDAGYSNISDAVTAAPASGATILVCRGNYDPFSISGRTKITVKAQDMDDRPVIRFPSTVSGGTLITVSGSTNITLDGLIVDGANFTDSYESAVTMRGIDWNSASGTIQNSRIIDMRDHPISGVLGIAIWIRDTSSQAAPNKITIKNNTILEYQSMGILATGPNKLTITGNDIDGANGETDGYGTYGVQIFSDNYGLASGTISKNLIVNSGVGVSLGDVSKVSVTRNTFHSTGSSVDIFSTCNYTLLTAPLGASSIKVTGNTMLQTNYGVKIMAQADNDGSGSLCDPKTNKNSISGNTIVAATTVSSEAILIQTTSTGSVTSFVPEAIDNKVTKNTTRGFLDVVKTVGNVSGTVISGNTVR